MISHPPYHLRPNKAVDRLTFLEVVKRIEKIAALKDYSYFGFGGPYLDEFQLLYEICPGLKMVSFERDLDTSKRQKFHSPCRTLDIRKQEFSSFLSTFSPSKTKCIFWLDYTDLDFAHFGEFMALLPKLPKHSVVKISLKCNPKDFQKAEQERVFVQKFGEVMPNESDALPRGHSDFASLLQKMIRIAAEKSLKGSSLKFQPLASFYYVDTVGMMTLTGMLCENGADLQFVKDKYSDWEFANLTWKKPKQINLPDLSMKERLALQPHLPSKDIRALNKILNHTIGGYDRAMHRKYLEQYAKFHRYFPQFMKVHT